jgi:hypothetical protein
MNVYKTVAAVVAALVLTASHDADAELRWSGGMRVDTHVRLNEVGEGPFFGPTPLEPGIARNESRLKLKLASLGDRFAGVADIDFVWSGVPTDVDALSGLSLRENTDPYWVETHALYIDAPEIFGEGIDLRVGFQKVMWGAGDQFNPTNNLNSEDLEDPLLFGDQQANFMIKLDWNELFGDDNEMTLTAVVVPVFKPALLPGSSYLGLAQTERLPFVDSTWNQVIASQQALATGMGFPVSVNQVSPTIPEPSLENVQAAVALQLAIGDHDLAFSYYVGRHDLPVAVRQTTVEGGDFVCDPADDSDCVKLLGTEIELRYPRMQVLGFNATGELDLLGWMSDSIHPLGYRLEAGLFFPERQQIRLFNDFASLPFPDGEYDYTIVQGSGGVAPEVLTDEPFAKWTLGLDYSLGEHVYVNAQWVHGLVDEFGAGDFMSEGYTVRSSGAVTEELDVLLGCVLAGVDGEGNPVGANGETCGRTLLAPRLADYLVVGADFKFMNQNALFRLFTILSLNGVIEDTYDAELGERVRIHHDLFSKQGFSMVVYPSLAYNFGDGLEMAVGSLINLGEPHTKFGDSATGGHLAWGRASYKF